MRRSDPPDDPRHLPDGGGAALDRAPYDLLLCDVNLPGEHGLSFVERALACTSQVGALRNLNRLEPKLARSRTYPHGRVYLGGHRTFIHVAGPVRWAMRAALPYRARGLVDAFTLPRALEEAPVSR